MEKKKPFSDTLGPPNVIRLNPGNRIPVFGLSRLESDIWQRRGDIKEIILYILHMYKYSNSNRMFNF